MRIRPIFELEINRRKFRLGEHTLVMGVLNVTPDSFSDGGRYLRPNEAIEHGLQLARAGADWIDVGGESTRPGARPVSPAEELSRVLPVIRVLRQRLRTIPISIDTTKARVAEEAVRAGATIINDVSGLRFDARVADVARRHRAPLILMHLRGRPETMQKGPFTPSVWRSVQQGLARSVRRALDRGVRRSQLIIDPGLGFGKTRRQNYEILSYLRRLSRFRLPILVGTSRKSFVQAIVGGEGLRPPRVRKSHAAHYWRVMKKTGEQPDAPLPLLLGDSAAMVASILAGAHIVRVHDVAAMMPAVRVADAILHASE